MAAVDTTILALTPLYYFKHAEGSGSTMTDSAGSPEHGAYVGTPHLDATGMYDGETCLELDGVSQYGKVEDPTKVKALSTGTPWTFTTFVQVGGRQSDGDYKAILNFHGSLGIFVYGNGFPTQANNNYGLKYGVGYAATGGAGYEGWSGLPSGDTGSGYNFPHLSPHSLRSFRWYNLTWTSDEDGLMRFYIRGSLVRTSQTDPFAVFPDSFFRLTMGARIAGSDPAGNFFRGKRARSAFFDYELTATEVASISTAAALDPVPDMRTLAARRSQLMVSGHFDLCIYTATTQGGTGHDDIDLFMDGQAATTIDVDAWVAAAAAAGADTFSINAKHVSGCCMWNTAAASTIGGKAYKIGASDWGVANNYSDLLTPLFAACRRYGLRPGLYFCLRDFSLDYENGFLTPALADNVNKASQAVYWARIKAQLDELFALLDDPAIDNITFDANPYFAFTSFWDADVGHCWDLYEAAYKYVKFLSPTTTVFLNSTFQHPADRDMMGYETVEPQLFIRTYAATAGTILDNDVVTQDTTGAIGYVFSASTPMYIAPIHGAFNGTDVIRVTTRGGVTQGGTIYITPSAVPEELGSTCFSWRTSLCGGVSVQDQKLAGTWFFDETATPVTPENYRQMLLGAINRGMILRWNLAPNLSGVIPAAQLLPLETYPLPSFDAKAATDAAAAAQIVTDNALVASAAASIQSIGSGGPAEIITGTANPGTLNATLLVQKRSPRRRFIRP